MNWEFPSSNNAGEQGPNDEGIQNFRGDEYKALAREMCQNSMDARRDPARPVHMDFEVYDVPARAIPDLAGYCAHLKLCRAYWQGNAEAQQYIDRCLDAVSQPYIQVLRVSDTNTNGLVRPYDPNCKAGWNTLVKITGAGNKAGDAGGSYGIGKKAAYLNSILRMVFYRTLTADGERAAQGVVRSISFCTDPKNPYSKTTGVGYYGDSAHNDPVPVIPFLEQLNRRTAPGTDVFIVGFDSHVSHRIWEKEVKRELLNNFVLALYENELDVTVQGEAIQAGTLDALVGAVGKRGAVDGINAYKVLTSPKTVTETRDFHGLGDLRLRLLVDPDDEGLNGKILVARKSKMTLFYTTKRQVNNLLNFNGILELEGEALNAFFKQMETPAHDKWKPTLHRDDRKLARQYYGEVYDWLKAMTAKYGYDQIQEETNVEGLNRMLQENPNRAQKGEDGQETLDVRDVEYAFVKKSTSDQVQLHISETAAANAGKPQKGDLTPNGSGGIRILKGKTSRRKRKKRYGGTVNPKGKDLVRDGSQTAAVEQLVNPGRVRVAKIAAHQFRFSLRPMTAFQKAEVEVRTIGENGSAFPLKALSAKNRQTGEALTCKNGRVEIGPCVETDAVRFDAALNIKRDLAMEVALYVYR
ncbi:MAG: hypothetical protein ACI39G_06680 [Pseudoramibacter sp.]